MMPIRPALPGELGVLRQIERRAGRAFAAVGMAEIAADEPPSEAALEAFRAARRAWIAAGPDGRPVAYLLAAVMDGDAHVEQVSVDPDHAGRGVGAALIDHLAGSPPWRGARRSR